MLLETTNILVIFSLMLSALCCLLAAYLIYKVRQIHVTLYGTEYAVKNLSFGLSQSLQQLELLSHELGLERPLPPLRGWVASPDVLLVLVHHVRNSRPGVIVECGSGASTVVLAQATKLNGRGRVYSIDHDADFAARTRAMLEEYGLSDWAEVAHAPLRWMEIGGNRWEWYDLDSLPTTPPIDLLFVDGPPSNTPKPLARYPAGPILFPRLSPHGAIFVDDAKRPGEAEILRRWSGEFPQLTYREHFCEKGCRELRVNDPSQQQSVVSPMPDGALPRRLSSLRLEA
jgi:predicted O-methyltransferase YrrM